MKATGFDFIDEPRRNPSELMDTSSRQGQLPLSGVTLNLHKFASIETADTCFAALGATGDEVDEAKLIAKEAKLRLEAYGAMDPDMFAHVSALPPATMLTVYVALTPPASIPDFREKESPYEAKKELTPMYTDTFADQVRNAFPDSNASAVSAAFAVTARLTADQTLAIARWSGVARVSGDIVTQDLSSAPAWYDTLRLSRIHLSLDCSSARVGFAESGVWTQIPELPAPQILRNGSNAVNSWHAGAVLGVMSNTSSGGGPGSCPGGSFFYAGTSSLAGDSMTSSIEAVGMLLKEQVDVINLSFYEGLNNPLDPRPFHTENPLGFGQYCEEQALDLGATIVAGGGQDAKRGGTWRSVPSPANAINVIAVGMYDDRRSEDWGDDGVDADGSHRNPPGVYGDRMKPDLTAPASDPLVVDLRAGGHLSFEPGTSFAAPMMSGTVGLIADHWRRVAGHGSRLGPEVNRAILAASAPHAVQGPLDLPRRIAGPRGPFTYPWTYMGDWDGAGSVDATAVKDIMTAGWFGQTQLFSCPAAQSRIPLAGARLDLWQGQKARVAMVFSSAASALYTPTADFDLIVAHVDPVTGSVIRINAWSTSTDANVENVEFQAEATGTYQLFLNTRSCATPSHRYIGYAWWSEP